MLSPSRPTGWGRLPVASLPSGYSCLDSALPFSWRLSAVVLQAQDQPTFRTGANYVRVDMYATVDGKSVEDLTAEEVEVLEDGVPQKIEAFEHVQVQTSRSAGITPASPSTVEQSRQMAAEARARVFVIFLDTYHTTIEGSSNMRLPLIKFLDRAAGTRRHGRAHDARNGRRATSLWAARRP